MRGNRSYVGSWISAAVLALQLMTRVPLPLSVPWNETVGRRSVSFYPLAGAIVGLLLGAVCWALPSVLPLLPSAVIAVAIWVWSTGALHLDGWMDTADALGSNRSRERMREIMKDPHVGAMGVAAGVLLLMGKVSLVYALLEAFTAGSLNVIAAVAAVPLLARAFVPWAVVGWPYAGGDAGMGAVLREAGWRHAVGSAVVAAVCIALLLLIFSSGDLLFLLPVVLAGAGLAAVGGVIGAFRLARRLGGLTGDTYGALIEGIELLLLLGMAVMAGGAV